MLGFMDYIIVGCFMFFFFASGFIFYFKNRKDTIIEYIVPSNVPIYQVSLSLIASFISAITVLGVPSEIYVNGASYIIICFAYILAILAANTLFIPVYYNCIKTSIFEYLEGRFNRLVAIFFAVIFVIQTIFYSSLALYGPSLAVSTVENVNIWYILCLIAFLSTIYTSLGGMKIVLWSDTIQALLILIGPIFIIFESAINNHGIINIVEKFNDYKKIPFFKFDLDLTTKNTVWQLIISGTIMYMSMYSSNQCEIQRLMTLRSLKKAKRSLWIIVPLKIIITLTMALCGICVNVYYGNEKLEGKNDQILPHYVNKVFSQYPCFTGIFYVSLLAATFSTLSTGINSITAVVVTEIFKNFFQNVNPIKQKNVSIIIAILIGPLLILCCYMVSYIDNILWICFSIYGIFGSAQMALIVMGIFVIPTNGIGAICGCFLGIIFTSILCIGKYLKLNHQIFQVNSMNYTFINLTISVMIGTLISIVTCCNKNKTVQPKYYSPLYKNYFEKKRKLNVPKTSGKDTLKNQIKHNVCISQTF